MVTNVPLWCGMLIRGEGHACIWAGGIREISVPFPQSCCEPKDKTNQQAKNPKKKVSLVTPSVLQALYLQRYTCPRRANL